MIKTSLSQRGSALLVVMCGVLLIAGVGVLGGRFVDSRQKQNDRQVTDTLARAKEALIGYAVNYADNYGHNTRGGVGRLPCPALQPHFRPASKCGRNALGYLPSVWFRDGKRMDIDHQEYFLNQNLWYAVSADFRYNPSFNKLNPDAGQFLSVNGQNDVVAVILSPGKALSSQTRDDVTRITDYLEAENADLDAVYASAGDSNDQLVTITRAELMPLIERRVLGLVRDWLVEYREVYGHLPYAAELGDTQAECQQGLTKGFLSMQPGNCSTPSLGEFVSASVPKGRRLNKTWFGAYDWSAFIYYQVDQLCVAAAEADCATRTEHTLHVNGKPATALLISTGRALHSEYLGAEQNRIEHPDLLSSYLDTAQLLTAEREFDFSHLDSSLPLASNDQYLVVRQ